MTIAVCKNISQLEKCIFAAKAKQGENLTLGLVPTMGALHAGHLSLCAIASNKASFVVATIFVNPKQFAEGEDLDKYPRTLQQDIDQLEAQGVNAVYIPQESEIYPANFSDYLLPEPQFTNILCDKHRAGHFDGVVTVVNRLFSLVKPNVAIFGEKDFQQLAILKAMAAIKHPNIKIYGAKLIREESGLAMSSRNKYLNPPERAIAASIYKSLNKLARLVKQEKSTRYPDNLKLKVTLQQERDNLLSLGFKEVQYLEIRKADDLSLLCSFEEIGQELQTTKEYRVFVAAMLGETRLIDNIEC